MPIDNYALKHWFPLDHWSETAWRVGHYLKRWPPGKNALLLASCECHISACKISDVESPHAGMILCRTETHFQDIHHLSLRSKIVQKLYVQVSFTPLAQLSNAGCTPLTQCFCWRIWLLVSEGTLAKTTSVFTPWHKASKLSVFLITTFLNQKFSIWLFL